MSAPITMAAIREAVAQRFGLSADDLRGAAKTRDVVRPRQMAFYLTRELTPMSYPQIGRFYRRDHATVISGYRNMRALIERDRDLRLVSLSLTSEVLNACA